MGVCSFGKSLLNQCGKWAQFKTSDIVGWEREKSVNLKWKINFIFDVYRSFATIFLVCAVIHSTQILANILILLVCFSVT